MVLYVRDKILRDVLVVSLCHDLRLCSGCFPPRVNRQSIKALSQENTIWRIFMG